MRAALLLRPGEAVIGEVPEPVPGPDDVRIAVGGVGLCGSDLSVFSGKWTAPQYPWIQGHEAFGTVRPSASGCRRAASGRPSLSSRTSPAVSAPSAPAVGHPPACDASPSA